MKIMNPDLDLNFDQVYSSNLNPDSGSKYWNHTHFWWGFFPALAFRDFGYGKRDSDSHCLCLGLVRFVMFECKFVLDFESGSEPDQ